MVASPIIYLVWNLFNNKEEDIFVNKKTGEETTLKQKHTFFFVEMQYWSYFIFFIGIVLVIKGFLGL